MENPSVQIAAVQLDTTQHSVLRDYRLIWVFCVTDSHGWKNWAQWVFRNYFTYSNVV